MIHDFTDTTLINKLCTYPYINTIDHNDILNGNKWLHKRYVTGADGYPTVNNPLIKDNDILP